jgi:hypothetical protein
MTITLATLEQATPQEVFNQVRDHLLGQAKKSTDHEMCVYRSGTVTKCAAGCLISDEEYLTKYEGNSWSSLVHDFDEVPKAHFDLISSLQDVHDDSVVYEWESQLMHLAATYNLTF